MANNPYKNFFGGYNSKKNAELGAAWERQNKINNDPILIAAQKADLQRKAAADKKAAELQAIRDIKATPATLNQQSLTKPIDKQVNKPIVENIKKDVISTSSKKYTPNFQSIAGIKEFQKRNGLKVDGIVGENTIGVMEKKKLVPVGTQAAFIEMQKTPIVKNESNIIASPEDKYVYGSDGKVTEAYFNGAENQFNKLKTTDIVKNTEAAHPGSTARIAELDKLFGNGQIPREAYNYSVNAILNPNQNSTPAQTIPQPQSQGILSSIGNWFTRERTPEEKQAMRQQVYDATGVDMGGQGGLAERSAY